MTEPTTFQGWVGKWMLDCFTPEIAADIVERNDRFLEEALELTQACCYNRARAHALVDYVFNRPIGDSSQEVGGVLVTLAALCNPNQIDMELAGQTELNRIFQPEIMEKIRAKQKTKPTGSALPQPIGQRRTMQCRHCESEDVYRDAYASWDIATQEWVLANVYDDAYCNKCECDTKLDERDIPGDLKCSVCDEPQFDTPSGLTCSNGHGGASSI